jgi:SOS-response transcriptional repressor LexA
MLAPAQQHLKLVALLLGQRDTVAYIHLGPALEAQMNRQMNQMSGERGPGFTPKQGQYLAFINAYAHVHRRPAAEADMQRYFGVTLPSVQQMILTLERAGLIRRRSGVPRSIEILVPPEDLPVLRSSNPTGQNSVPMYQPTFIQA